LIAPHTINANRIYPSTKLELSPSSSEFHAQSSPSSLFILQVSIKIPTFQVKARWVSCRCRGESV